MDCVINARLLTALPTDTKSSENDQIDATIYITRGASANLSFDLLPKVYRFDDIKQCTFIFGINKLVYSYELYDDAHQINDGWSHVENYWIDPVTGEDYDGDCNYINLKLLAEDTKIFSVTKNCKMKFEVVIELVDGTTIIEQQPSVVILDSLIGKIE